jgi:hypothetical protein
MNDMENAYKLTYVNCQRSSISPIVCNAFQRLEIVSIQIEAHSVYNFGLFIQRTGLNVGYGENLTQKNQRRELFTAQFLTANSKNSKQPPRLECVRLIGEIN